jgi:small subunit ribosomal protein S6
MQTAERQYELVYIAGPDSSEQEIADLHTQVEQIAARFNGRVEKTENWGKRKLAYEIGRHREGVYVLEHLSGTGEMTKEIDRRLKVSDVVIRHLIVRVDEDLEIANRATTRRKEESARRRIARGLPPEPDPSERRSTNDDDLDADGGMEDLR